MGHGTPLPTHDHIHRVGQTLSFQMIPNTCTLLAFCRLWDQKDWRVNVWEAWILGFLVVIEVCTITKKHSSWSFLSSYRLDITENRSTYLSICVCDRFNRYFTLVWAHIVLTTCQNVVQYHVYKLIHGQHLRRAASFVELSSKYFPQMRKMIILWIHKSSMLALLFRLNWLINVKTREKTCLMLMCFHIECSLKSPLYILCNKLQFANHVLNVYPDLHTPWNWLISKRHIQALAGYCVPKKHDSGPVNVHVCQ